MGRPSNRMRSARRLGKRERARRKNNRAQVWYYVPSGDTAHVKYGRKHTRRVWRKIASMMGTPSVGEPLKTESVAVGRMAWLKPHSVSPSKSESAGNND